MDEARSVSLRLSSHITPQTMLWGGVRKGESLNNRGRAKRASLLPGKSVKLLCGSVATQFGKFCP